MAICEPECGLTLASAHPVGSADEFSQLEPKPAIDQVHSVSLRHDNVVLLTQIARDVLGAGSHLRHTIDGSDPLTPFGDLAGSAHPNALHLPRGDRKCLGKFGIAGTVSEPVKQLLSLFGGYRKAGMVAHRRGPGSPVIVHRQRGGLPRSADVFRLSRRVARLEMWRGCNERVRRTREFDRLIERHAPQRLGEQPKPPGRRVFEPFKEADGFVRRSTPVWVGFCWSISAGMKVSVVRYPGRPGHRGAD
jgi:hypothetical protein